MEIHVAKSSKSEMDLSQLYTTEPNPNHGHSYIINAFV